MKVFNCSISDLSPASSLIFAVSILCSLSTWAEMLDSKITLGQTLYFDPNLSLNRTQACASCHDPNKGFTDSRDFSSIQAEHLNGVVSLGDDNTSFGDRSAPTVSYANQTPTFHKNSQGEYIGGLFWDGRASNLTEQAKGPPLNPIEMGAPSKHFIKERLMENSVYISAFKTLYGSNIFDDSDQLYHAMADSIAAFENTEYFSPFDSKYDRYLKGEYELSAQEDLGMTLFFSQQFTNCNQCHQLKKSSTSRAETFTNYRYHNIGTPVNTMVREQKRESQTNKANEDTADLGLFHHPDVTDPKQKGKFKVPTLRNVAVTGPYMHNGVFNELTTVVAFYNKYNSKNPKRQINPETGEPWRQPEVAENLSLKELESGPALDDKRIKALVAFMRILTDRRYEHLLE